MKKLFTIACLLGLNYCSPKWHQLENYTFDQYTKDFNKDYTPSELASRKQIFEQQLLEIIAFNKDPSQTYKQGVNKFTDLSTEEYVRSIKGYRKDMRGNKPQAFLRDLSQTQYETPSKEEVASLPVNVDWRKAGKTTPVKDQGGCGSCWAFASAATIEGHVAINSGVLQPLSTQQLVSCVANPYTCGGDGGCAGAISELAFSYAQIYGLTSESEYPYSSASGVTGACQYDSARPTAAVEVDGYLRLPVNDYDSLLQAVANVGPIAVSVDASKWSRYESGVFNGCDYSKNIDINHAVVLEGYGSDASLGDYWLIRNSWGSSYGEDGYIRLARESVQTCGVDSTPHDGVACFSQDAPTKVCGQCGVTSDSAYPLNARVAL